MTTLAPQMTERDLQQAVIDMAHLFRWRVAHFRPAQNRHGRWGTPVQADAAGFPDLIMVRAHRIIAAELKAGRNKTTAEQDTWLAHLAETGVECFVWRPEDFHETILEILR